MSNYDGKYGTVDNSDDKSIIENLFINSDTPNLIDTDETLEVPSLSIDVEDVDKRTRNRASIIVDRLSAYYFDQKYIDEHPYIPNKIAQEVDNIRRLLKMLAVNEKAQDTTEMEETYGKIIKNLEKANSVIADIK